MSQVVQSACPGCKHRLRIPAEWLHQSIRCKHCGMVLQVKPPAESARAPAAPPRKEQVKPAAAVPLAAPVAPPANDQPFGDFHVNEDETASRIRRHRRKSSGWWKGPALAVAVFTFILSGFALYLNWDRLAALLTPNDETPAPQKPTDQGIVAQTPAKTNKAQTVPVKPPRQASHLFPRRALVISIHDYLYANPLQNGMPGTNASNFNNFLNSLSAGLHVSPTQIAYLSDEAGPKWGARAPTRAVIEKTVTNFLDSSRPQDRILVFFIGHAVEVGDDVYLAPIEGELDQAKTLIPLKWFYEQLARCKARQKVLVLDGNRYHRTFGQERPGGDEMGPKLDAMLQAPPPGVQVWSSCIAKQRSYASDDSPMGIFLESLQKALQQGGKIQTPEEPLPLQRYVERVNKLMRDDLSKRKLEQVSRLTGKEPESGAAYDPKEPAPPDAKAVLAPPPSGVRNNEKLVKSVLDQIGTPPIKVTHEAPLRYDALPPFSGAALKKYEDDKPDPNSPLRKAVTDARAILWAIYPGKEPQQLSGEVSAMRQKYQHVQLSVLKEGYRAPGGGNAEKAFKDRVENDERRVAMILTALRDALNDLQDPKVVEARENESKRWQVNYDFMLARVQLEYAYLIEYQSMLGSIRKEFPPLNPELHNGWKLASQSKLQGDSAGKKAAKDGQKLLDKIIKSNAGTPWEVLAKREKLTNLGLEWRPAR